MGHGSVEAGRQAGGRASERDVDVGRQKQTGRLTRATPRWHHDQAVHTEWNLAWPPAASSLRLDAVEGSHAPRERAAQGAGHNDQAELGSICNATRSAKASSFLS